jgi:hypothetical protein
VLQQGFIIMISKPVSAEFHHFKLPLEILISDPTAEVLLSISRWMYEVPQHTNNPSVIADPRPLAISVIIQNQAGG